MTLVALPALGKFLAASAGVMAMHAHALHGKRESGSLRASSEIRHDIDATIVYFGNGCFWARQKTFVDVELRDNTFNRSVPTSLVGYAGGTMPQHGNSVCYYGGGEEYAALGHAEVVGVLVDSTEQQLRSLAKAYFNSFLQTPSGAFDRSDQADSGAGYRNVIGIPGGMLNNDALKIIEEAREMAGRSALKLLPGKGSDPDTCATKQSCWSNTVWVLDSTAFPFFRAEQKHQFHQDISQSFKNDYVVDLKDQICRSGVIPPLLECSSDCGTGHVASYDGECCSSIGKPNAGLQAEPWTNARSSSHPKITRANTRAKGQLTCKTLALLQSWEQPSKSTIQTDLQEKLQLGQAEPLAFRVTQEAFTESPHTGKYAHEERTGIYVDVVSGEPLFSSHDKFNSGTGWPSFSRPMKGVVLVEKPEARTFGEGRVEVRSLVGNSHLGHVFEDGSGLGSTTEYRYCINSASLRFIPDTDPEYQSFIKLCDCPDVVDLFPKDKTRHATVRDVCVQSGSVRTSSFQAWALSLAFLFIPVLMFL